MKTPRSDLFEFRWLVNTEGYRWVESTPVDLKRGSEEKQKEHFITDARPGTFMARVYYPLSNDGLFLRFANITPSMEGIRSFANEFGLLGEGARTSITVEALPENQQSITVEGGTYDFKRVVWSGESISEWNRQVFRMRQTLRLWQLVQSGDLKELSRYILWRESGDGVRYDSHPELPPATPLTAPDYRSGAWIASNDFNPELLSMFQRGDPVKPALYYVQTVVNESLRGLVSPRMLWGQDGTQLGLHIVPASLLGGLWLQFAQSITGNKKYRQCRRCENFFELSPRAARTNRQFCTDACKSKAFRERFLEARQLAAGGMAMSDIAARLHSDVGTVTRWVMGDPSKEEMAFLQSVKRNGSRYYAEKKAPQPEHLQSLVNRAWMEPETHTETESGLYYRLTNEGVNASNRQFPRAVKSSS